MEIVPIEGEIAVGGGAERHRDVSGFVALDAVADLNDVDRKGNRGASDEQQAGRQPAGIDMATARRLVHRTAFSGHRRR